MEGLIYPLHYCRGSDLVKDFGISTIASAKAGNDATLTGNVMINETQYFDGVREDVWGFMIGGYQVCEKWLKDRRGRVLSYEDVQHYQKICVALGETIRLLGDERLAIFE